MPTEFMKCLYILLLSILVNKSSAVFIVNRNTLTPIILVPGDGGSQVEAKLHKEEVVHYLCEKTTQDFFNIWLNMELLVPLVIDCWVLMPVTMKNTAAGMRCCLVCYKFTDDSEECTASIFKIDNMKLVYDNVTRTTSNSKGVEIRIPGFGDTTSIEWLDPSEAFPGAYFKDIANTLVALGYERNISLRGAPYDFRKAPNENGDYFVRLKALVEETYRINDNHPVIILAHSMGGPMSLHFLHIQSKAWKDQYIRALVTLSGAWGGSVKALKVYAVGDDLGSYILSESTLREEQITSPSLAWLMPSSLFWNPDEILIRTDGKNYTVKDFKEFFEAIEYPMGWEMRKDVERYSVEFQAPDVEVHCLHGYGVNTINQLIYKPKTFPDGYPGFLYGDGDGTVNRRSLEGCLKWQGKQKENIYYQTFSSLDHMSILRDKRVLSYIETLIGKL